MNPPSGPRPGGYVGRFAPSPTGDLHLGSLYTATGAYLDARSHQGRFLLRIDDLDRPRERPGAADRILRTLEAFGFEWDGPVVQQSARAAAHGRALAALRALERLYPCDCTRRERALGVGAYPGTCRHRREPIRGPHALRVRVDPIEIDIDDRIQGRWRRNLAATGDFIVQRRDGIVAYPLAVVVDDAALGVTDVVRGADLLDSTPAQRFLQTLLSLPTPRYAHLPVLTEPDGAKLAKSRRSVPLDARIAGPQLATVFDLLGLAPPAGLARARIEELWAWGVAHWNAQQVPRRPNLPLPAPTAAPLGPAG